MVEVRILAHKSTRSALPWIPKAIEPSIAAAVRSPTCSSAAPWPVAFIRFEISPHAPLPIEVARAASPPIRRADRFIKRPAERPPQFLRTSRSVRDTANDSSSNSRRARSSRNGSVVGDANSIFPLMGSLSYVPTASVGQTHLRVVRAPQTRRGGFRFSIRRNTRRSGIVFGG